MAGDTINVAEGTYTGSGTEVVLIDQDVDLSGGWDSDFSTQSGMSTIDSQNTRRGIKVESGVTGNIEFIEITNGNVGGASPYGGGVFNAGILIISNSIISNNIADSNSSQSYGGGIYNEGTLTINNSTLSDNYSEYYGGGLYGGSDSAVAINNSTISGNSTGDMGYSSGGAISKAYSSILTISSSTISNNHSARNAGGAYLYGNSTIRNSIVAGNTAVQNGPDCYTFGTTVANLGYNLIGDSSGCFPPGVGDITDVDPLLGPLVGSPGYHPLSSSSPAVNAGNPVECTDDLGNPLNTDQRGVARSGNCDIGSYEYISPGSADSIFVVSGSPQSNTPNEEFPLPLEAVVLDATGSPVNGVTVTFTAPASGASGTFDDTGTEITTAITNEYGIATSALITANSVEGIYVVSATVSGVGTSADFELGNVIWYVSTSGSDSNDCLSPATTCASINAVLSKPLFNDGNLVRVASGTYMGTEGFVLTIRKGVILGGGWDAGFTSQNGFSVIDGEDSRSGVYINTFSSSNSYVSLENFEIKHSNNRGLEIRWGLFQL